ncbi:hypothetical protein QAD02_017358 [Eretmocerus hayati]|uniref:Uncharacterized protein n=1 Tax=Eretmocerus hayati TaxID=131215 RepID=A0ACC2PFH1_9HYME|nr:hypothetical protein QAD02_017358 [Eretmocerus hayati]
MPAVSVMCDPLAVAMRHNLDPIGQSKSADDLDISLIGSGPRILQSKIDYDETDSHVLSIQDRLKSKYIVLSSPKQENTECSTKIKDGASCSKSTEKNKEPRLPEPAVTLYSADQVNLGWNKNFPVGAGMYNVGNTCYLNSTLQALFHVPALVNWLLSDPHHEAKCEQSDQAGECLTCAVAKTLQFSHQKSGESIKPFHVYNKLKLICRTMVPGQQEDAHEFLRYLLEGMEKAYIVRHKAQKLDSYSKETTPINQIFGGYIRTEVKCLQCRHISTTFQHFQDLLLDIRKANSLDEALASYFGQEQLDNNDYKCEACKRRVPATKQFILERPPKVLCIQLKRFSVLGGKISRHIDFKSRVDMSPYVRRQGNESSGRLIYRLTSMVTHMGVSVNCGHYTAIAQVSSGKFYCFDDSCVRQIGLNNVVSTNAYIMIFEMEPTSPTSNTMNLQSHGNQLVSSKNSDGPSVSKSSQPLVHTNGLVSKLSDSNNSRTQPSPSKSGDLSSTSKSKETSSNTSAPSPPAPPLPSLPSLSNGRRDFIGPQLPPHMEKNRLAEVTKNSKLVDYDGGSSDDEEKNDSTRNQASRENDGYLSKNAQTNSNGHFQSSQSAQRSSPSHYNGSNQYSSSNGMEANGPSNFSKRSNKSGSRSSSRGSSPSSGFHNDNTSYNESSNERWKEKCPNKPFEQRIHTKASASDNKGWSVCPGSTSPSPAAVANGWSVDSVSNESFSSSSSRQNNHSTNYNAGGMKNFSGSHRPDIGHHLQKSSQWAYGNSNVQSWNGGKARMDRDVDNQRRQDRKRPYDDDSEIDRGRMKKVKMHNGFKNHHDSKYNAFQERHNMTNGQWKSMGNHHRPNNGGHYERHVSSRKEVASLEKRTVIQE